MYNISSIENGWTELAQIFFNCSQLLGEGFYEKKFCKSTIV
jgi:hypothetical protein